MLYVYEFAVSQLLCLCVYCLVYCCVYEFMVYILLCLWICYQWIKVPMILWSMNFVSMSLLPMNCCVYEFSVCELLCLWVYCQCIVVTMSLLSVNCCVYEFAVFELWCLWVYCQWIVVSMSLLSLSCHEINQSCINSFSFVNQPKHRIRRRDIEGNFSQH